MASTNPPAHNELATSIVGPITVVHVALMIALAVVAVLMIWYGSVQRAKRREAEKDVAESWQIAEAAGATAPPQRTDPNEPDGASQSPVSARESVPDEPVAASSPAETAPATPRDVSPPPSQPEPVAAQKVTPAAPAPAAPGADSANALTQLKGLGPKLALTLAELGYTRVDQIAALTPDAASALDAQLGAFKGRMARDRWIEQAKLLSAGDRAGYEAQFGKL